MCPRSVQIQKPGPCYNVGRTLTKIAKCFIDRALLAESCVKTHVASK